MSNPIRKQRQAWNEPGHAHFVTYSTYRRLPLLQSPRVCDWIVNAMSALRTELLVALWAYVIMPEHVHVLLHPRDQNYEMRRILAGLKRSVSKSAREYLVATNQTEWLDRLTARHGKRRVFRFWQPGGGFDRNIFRDRSIPAIIDYIHANPVRRELCKSPTDWKYSSARFWEGHHDVPLKMDHPDDSLKRELKR